MTNSSPGTATKAGALLAFFVIVGAVIAMFLAFQFAQSEADRDSLIWQRQMAVVINSREVALEDWVAEQKKVIQRLADNPALRIYLSNITAAKGAAALSSEDKAQAAYLENQMKAVALQNGYVSATDPAYAIKANLPAQSISGLALTNPEGQLVVSTPQMPSVIRSMADFLAQGAANEVIVSGPYLAENRTAVLGFIAPIFGVQEDDTSPAIGFAVGIKPVPQDFYEKLVQPGDTSVTARNYLVRAQRGSIEYLSEVKSQNGNDQGPLELVLDATNGQLAAAFALQTAEETTGGFAEKVNFDGEKVLVTGRKIKDTNWVLVRTVESAEVLGAIEARKRTILWIAGLTIVAVTIAILLMWRHGVSVRVARAAHHQRLLARKYEKLSHFLQIVTDSQPTAIAAVDDRGRYSFANVQAAKDTGMASAEMIGQKISALNSSFISPKAAYYVDQVLAEGKAVSVLEQLPDSKKTVKSDYVPLSVEAEKGVLMVTEDVSEVVRERELKETALKNLVSTLTMVIDSRDPYSARHSERVAQVALAIAVEMDVDDVTRDTANIAGALMNLGKILVPRELLTRPKGLSAQELATVRNSIMKSAEMLETVEFEGPVVETLRQIRAHWDGSGVPEGLSGADILMSARIVAVANAFVGMSSARAHRAGMDMVQAGTLLLNDADRIYDRKPVTALMNYLENKDGLLQWQAFGVPLPASPASSDPEAEF